MKITNTMLSTLAASAMFGLTTTALPTRNEFSLAIRQDPPPGAGPKLAANTGGAAGNIAGIIKKILLIATKKTNSYDYDKNLQMCKVSWGVKRPNKDCWVKVACNDGGERDYPVADCNEGVTNDFNDDRIGPFHISYMSTSMKVLSAPVLNVDFVDNGSPWDVAGIAAQDTTVCGTACETGLDGEHTKCQFYCGVPKVGKSAGGKDGANSEGPTNEAGFAPGWCGVHVTQHQKADPAVDNYHFDVSIKDNNENEIGGKPDLELATDASFDIISKLPAPLRIIAGATDDSVAKFEYNGQYFGSNDQEHSCNFGQYSGGKREGDCGFTC
jgi:hypothetical protein